MLVLDGPGLVGVLGVTVAVVALTIRGYPRRVVFDWAPADGHHAAWLARLEQDGWKLDFGSTEEGSPVVLGGREVLRHAMRESEPARQARETQKTQKTQDRERVQALAAAPARSTLPESFEGGWWEHVGDGGDGDDSPGWVR